MISTDMAVVVVEDEADRRLAERIDGRAVAAGVLPRLKAPGPDQILGVHRVLLP